MHRKLITAGLLSAAITAIGPAGAAAATPAQLVLPQGTAFAILGHSCGGIQEKAYATGFDPSTGDPQGDVYISTSCGGSGRDGGGHSTLYSAWTTVTWGFDGSLVSDAVLASAPVVDPGFSATDGHGDTVSNSGNQAYVTALVAAAPTAITASPSGGQYLIAWSADPTAPPGLISSSTITATPVGSTAPVVTATVAGAAAQGLLGPLEPNTSYDVTVTSNDAAGASSPGGPIPITTGAGALKPGRPTGLGYLWGAEGENGATLTVSWSAGAPGDSPTDEYGIRLTSFGGGVKSATVSGSTLTDAFTVDAGVAWRVQVRAHDQSGWGPWSAALKVPASGDAPLR